MAYADYAFYFTTYGGDTLDETTAAKWLERASDEVDGLTSFRLVGGLPDDEFFATRIKKAVCAIADALYGIDLARQAGTPTTDETGAVRGAVASISSGRESISFASASSGGAYYKAASSKSEETKLLTDIAYKYLANVPASDGVNLLYRGGYGHRHV